MRIKIYILFIVISLCFIFSCSVNRKISSIFLFKGEIEIENSSIYKFKYFLNVDSSKNLRFKIYNVSGIKISEFILKDDSLSIKYLIDNSFQVMILEQFKRNNLGKCLREIIYNNGYYYLRNELREMFAYGEMFKLSNLVSRHL